MMTKHFNRKEKCAFARCQSVFLKACNPEDQRSFLIVRKEREKQVVFITFVI